MLLFGIVPLVVGSGVLLTGTILLFIGLRPDMNSNLKALSGRSRIVHRHGRDLADEVLAEARRRRRLGGG